MRIIVDVMGAPEGSGGMNLYARELIAAWADAHRGDDLILVGGRWITEAFRGTPGVTTVPRKRAGVLARMWAQLVVSGLRYYRHRADVLLSVSPIASPLVPRSRRAVVIHDWRHFTRPEEFSFAQRAYRQLWKWSIGSAGLTIAISEKTARETERYAAPRRLMMVRNGGDHARRWDLAPPADIASRNACVVTFGHLPNKRPELAMEAYALATPGPQYRLVVLGANGEYRAGLSALAQRLGVADRVDFPGFVDERTYQQLIQSASAVVLTSSDEGFGLPIAEAAYFGVPAVVTRDSGLAEIHQGVIAASPDAESISQALQQALSAPRNSRHRGANRWQDAASEIRAGVCVA